MRPKPLELPALLLMTTSPLTREFFERADVKLKHTTLICSNCLIDACDLLNRTLIAYIVIDENMPNLDLVKACMEIRQLKDHRCTPILIITSRLKKSFMDQLLKAGATDFLIEPLEEEELVCCMKQAKSVGQTRKKLSKLSPPLSLKASQRSSIREKTILDSRAVKLILEMLRENKILALLLLEVDQYDLIQSTHGSLVIDELFMSVQMHLQKVVRKQDLLFPQKKGKFLMVLPKTTSKAALLIAENVQESLKLKPFQLRGKQFELSVSIGLVALDEQIPKKNITSLFDYLIKKAKICLEKAKKRKDSIVVYSSKKGILFLILLLSGTTFFAQGAASHVDLLSPAHKAPIEERVNRELPSVFREEKKVLSLAQSGRSEVMIIDPKTRAQDLQEVFEYLRKKSPSSQLSVKLVNQSLIRDILDMVLMSNGTMIIFRIHSPQGHRFEVVKIEEIETITNNYANDSSYLFKKLSHPRAALSGRSTSAHN